MVDWNYKIKDKEHLKCIFKNLKPYSTVFFFFFTSVPINCSFFNMDLSAYS